MLVNQLIFLFDIDIYIYKHQQTRMSLRNNRSVKTQKHTQKELIDKLQLEKQIKKTEI